MRLLLVEDDPEMATLIVELLQAASYNVDWVRRLDEAEVAIRTYKYSLIVLDRRLPDGDGISSISACRNLTPDTPIIILSALNAISDRVAGLDSGADDYVTKPFDKDEFIARTRAALRRRGGNELPVIKCGSIAFDPNTRDITIGGNAVVLRRREKAVLEVLLERVGRVTTRETIISTVYGFDDQVSETSIEVHISRLRTRLVSIDESVVIHTVRGIGYILDAE